MIVGDAGYPNRPYLCTPFTHRGGRVDRLTAPEKAYQKSLLTTRNTVERSYGLLKRRFPILMYGIQVKRVAVIQKIIAVCAVLHNICIDMGDFGVDDIPMPNWPNVLPPLQPDQEESIPPQMVQGMPARRNAVDVIVDIFAQRQQR